VREPAREVLDLVVRALELESGSVPGATNLVFEALFIFAIFANLGHEIALAVIDGLKEVAFAIINFFGRVIYMFQGYLWNDIKTKERQPHGSSALKLGVVFAIFGLLCPVTLALLGY
jgi:hypothetical protein